MNGSCIDYSGAYGGRGGWGWNSNVDMFNVLIPSTIEGAPVLKYNSDLTGFSNKGGCSSFSNTILEPTLNSLKGNNWIIQAYKIGTNTPIVTPVIEDGMCKINLKAYQASFVPNSNRYQITGYDVGNGVVPFSQTANNINLKTIDGTFYLNGTAINSPSSGGFYAHKYVTVYFNYYGELPYKACPSTHIFLNGKCTSQNFSENIKCPSGYTDNGTNCQKSVSFDFYQYTCPSTYTPINYGFTSYTKTDPNTSTQNWNTLDDAVNSATAPIGNCQKTITYSYYKYNCPTGYTVRDGGLTSACPRTDPNNTINNESTLSQPCNNSTPPTGNCEKIIPYTFYSYECSSGYTAIDKGLASCTKTDSSTSSDTSSTLSQPCNSATPPKENCYKDISYKHYTYGCSPGYITDNYGLSIMEQYI